MKPNLTHPTLNNAGYTLLELVVVAAIIMFAGTFFIRLSSSITGRGQFRTTDNRQQVITAKIRQYYLAHEQLPASAPAAGSATATVPVTDLNLEQKYRLDGWGNYFQYTTSTSNPGTVTGLQDVNDTTGNMYAAAVISNGPDQILGTVDDITVYIDLSTEATKIVYRKLKVLMEKTTAYDAMFAGIDNDGVNHDNPAAPNRSPVIDEDPLDPVNPLTSGCPPVSGFSNDPATGLPTLDAIAQAMMGVGGNPYSCPANDPSGNRASLAYHLAAYHHLPTGFPKGYDRDPWNQPFHWGYPGRALDDLTPLDPKTNARYHTFYSSGPDTTINTDDILW